MRRASGSSRRSVRSAGVAITQSPTQFGSKTPIRTPGAPYAAEGRMIGNQVKLPNGSLRERGRESLAVVAVPGHRKHFRQRLPTPSLLRKTALDPAIGPRYGPPPLI